jgi:DUF1009 family protein
VAPDLLAEAGRVGAAGLSPAERRDADVGFAVRAALGPLDAGQAVVVAGGRVLAIEGAEGTDAMLERVAARRQGRSSPLPAGVLAKGPKPGQEMRVDMPVIGARTVELAAAAGLAGVAVEAGGVLVLGREDVAQAAAARGLAIEGLPMRVGDGPVSGAPVHWGGRVMGRLRPTRGGRRDVETGLAAVDRLAPFRTGSAAVVSRAYILALAADETATAMLDRARGLRQWGMRGKSRVGVLACRADATEGVDAVRMVCEQAAAQGLAGIAVTGPADVLAPYEEMSPVADGLGLFLLTCPRGDGR